MCACVIGGKSVCVCVHACKSRKLPYLDLLVFLFGAAEESCIFYGKHTRDLECRFKWKPMYGYLIMEQYATVAEMEVIHNFDRGDNRRLI